jgi:hypothetical protein
MVVNKVFLLSMLMWDCWILKPEFTVPFPAPNLLRWWTYPCFPTISLMWVCYVRNGKHYKLRIITKLTFDLKEQIYHIHYLIISWLFCSLHSESLLSPNVIIPCSDFLVFLVDTFNTTTSCEIEMSDWTGYRTSSHIHVISLLTQKAASVKGKRIGKISSLMICTECCNL